MMTPEIRAELRAIQAELKKVFPAAKHEVRKLPGTEIKWVYLRWQTIRDRLDEVCPDWIVDYSEVQYFGNEAIARCGITILGVRKEALSSVPISLTSKQGNEMTIGSPTDRVAAEGLKNAGELWGIGRYLDEQEFTIRYLWDHMSELDDDMKGEVRRLSEQYKEKATKSPHSYSPKPKETGFINSVAGVSDSPALITEGQRKRLWAIAKSELKLEDNQIKSAYKQLGFEKTEDITKLKYEDVISNLRNVAAASIPQVKEYPANNEIIKKIRAATRHDPKWILAQCKHYGCEVPAQLPPEELGHLVVDMLTDWAIMTALIDDRAGASASAIGAIAYATTNGVSIADAAINWIESYSAVTA